MDHCQSRRGFMHFAAFLLAFGFAICGAHPMARAPAPLGAVPELNAKPRAAGPESQDATIDGYPVSLRSRHAPHLGASGPKTALPVVAVPTGESGAFVELPIALRLQ